MDLDKISLTRIAIDIATRDATDIITWHATDNATRDAIDDATRIAIGTQHIITDSIWDILDEL